LYKALPRRGLLPRPPRHVLERRPTSLLHLRTWSRTCRRVTSAGRAESPEGGGDGVRDRNGFASRAGRFTRRPSRL